MEHELTRDVIQSVSVQAGDGCYRITLPKGAAEELGIDADSSILFIGKEGDRSLTVRNGRSVVLTD